MPYGANAVSVPTLPTYGAAVDWEANVKPIRGRNPECKPVGKRSKTYVSIRKENDDIVVRLYRTDIVRWKRDGTVIVNQGGHESITTREYLNALLPMWFNAWQGMTNVWRGIEGDGRYLLHASEDNIFKLVEGTYEPNNVSSARYRFVNPRPCVVHSKNRAKSKEVRARYAPFINYVRRIRKLMGGDIMTNQTGSTPWIRPDEMLSLALANDPEGHHAVMAQLARYHSWGAKPNVLGKFESILMQHHRDEMLDEIVMPHGELDVDKFKRLF